MALMQFSDKYHTGIAQVDNQHKKLFDLINELNDAMKQGKGSEVVGKTLDALMNYTVTHFKDEEALMVSKKYPGYLSHKMQHDQFVAKVKEMAEKQKAGRSLVQIEVSKFLADWLTGHIIKTDMMYVSHLT